MYLFIYFALLVIIYIYIVMVIVELYSFCCRRFSYHLSPSCALLFIGKRWYCGIERFLECSLIYFHSLWQSSCLMILRSFRNKLFYCPWKPPSLFLKLVHVLLLLLMHKLECCKGLVIHCTVLYLVFSQEICTHLWPPQGLHRSREDKVPFWFQFLTSDLVTSLLQRCKPFSFTGLCSL